MLIKSQNHTVYAIVLSMITTIIFDYYGVFQLDIYVEWLTRNGFERNGIFDVLAKQLDHGEITRDEFAAKLSSIIQRPVSYEEIYSPSVTIDKSMVELAKNLHRSYKLGLLSNASKDLRQKLNENNIDNLFNVITISSEVGVAKPESEIYELTLKKLASSAHETLYIDDNARYLLPAESLGMETVHFTTTEDLNKSLREKNITLT